MLQLQQVGHSYKLRNRPVRVLQDLNHTFAMGSFTSIRGASGSGKSTLLNILGLLDTPSDGLYLLSGADASKLSDNAKSELRAKMFGYLFQDFRLIPTRTALQNVRLNLDISAGVPADDRDALAKAALERVGLAERFDHLPPELSGGEAQRVAFARAIVKQPKILLADEPTGNLDVRNRDHLLALINDFHQNGGTVVMVTHDETAAQYSDERLGLQDGRLQRV